MKDFVAGATAFIVASVSVCLRADGQHAVARVRWGSSKPPRPSARLARRRAETLDHEKEPLSVAVPPR
jgi:hypothetical protein